MCELAPMRNGRQLDCHAQPKALPQRLREGYCTFNNVPHAASSNTASAQGGLASTTQQGDSETHTQQLSRTVKTKRKPLSALCGLVRGPEATSQRGHWQRELQRDAELVLRIFN